MCVFLNVLVECLRSQLEHKFRLCAVKNISKIYRIFNIYEEFQQCTESKGSVEFAKVLDKQDHS